MIELDKVETKAAQYSRRNNVELTYDISNYIPEKLFKDTIINICRVSVLEAECKDITSYFPENVNPITSV